LNGAVQVIYLSDRWLKDKEIFCAGKPRHGELLAEAQRHSKAKAERSDGVTGQTGEITNPMVLPQSRIVIRIIVILLSGNLFVYFFL
jgi:hypothetical protein